MISKHVTGAVLLSMAALVCAPTSFAAQADPGATKEAKERETRAVHLFENRDYKGALTDFQRANELVPSPALLFQIARTFAAMDRPADALDTLDDLLSEPKGAKPALLARAKALKEEQEKLVGELDVKANVKAAIFIDGTRMGDTPLEDPLQVTAGQHQVSVTSPGYAPARQTVNVTAQGRVDVAFELQASDTKSAHVTISCPVPGVEVRVDDQSLGKTPFADQVAIPPGKHVFEAQRPGYMTASKTIDLAAGVYRTIAFDPDEDNDAEAERGKLRVSTVPAGNLQVTIDGRFRGAYRKPIPLPAGPHEVKVDRDGYESIERSVDVPAGGEAEIKVSLRPSEEVRKAKLAKKSSNANWAVAALVASGVVLGGSIGALAYGQNKLPAARSALNIVRQDAVPDSDNQCDPNKRANPATNPTVADFCRTRLNNAQSDYDLYSNLRLYGIIGTVAGSLLVAGSVALLVTMLHGEPDSGGESVAATLVPVVSAGPNGATLLLQGRF